MEEQSPRSPLGGALLDMVHFHRGPFGLGSLPVKLVYDPQLHVGHAAVCDKSVFMGRSFVLYVVGSQETNKDQMLFNAEEVAEANLAFRCSEGSEIVRVNETEAQGLEHEVVLAKLTF
jgi:hypothetical protein